MGKCAKDLVSRMDKRVAIQSASQVSDGQGGYSDVWATLATVWANIEPTKGWERMQAQQLQSPVTHKVKMRYYSGLTTKHRLLYGTRVLDIKEVINEGEANSFHTLQCVETGN